MKSIAWLGVLAGMLLGASVVVALLGLYWWAALLGIWSAVVVLIQIADRA